MIDIKLCEELSLNAHPSIKTIVYDGWILRFANGFTGRANSVNMIYSYLPENSTLLEEKINHCEALYKNEGLKTIFKVTPLNKDIDELLEQKGYKIVTPTKIMCMPLHESNEFKIVADINKGFTESWQQNYLRLKSLLGTKDENIAKQIQNNIQQSVFTASITQNNNVIACGMCVIEREWVGLYDIFVDANCRGQGLGFAICSSLLQTAFKNGAKNAYLQVVEDNTPAVKLYEKLGYKDCYQYWYRVR